MFLGPGLESGLRRTLRPSCRAACGAWIDLVHIQVCKLTPAAHVESCYGICSMRYQRSLLRNRSTTSGAYTLRRGMLAQSRASPVIDAMCLEHILSDVKLQHCYLEGKTFLPRR